jgi:hypothetical protein
MTSKKLWFGVVGGLLFLNLLIGVYFAGLKNYLHVDEIFSYGHANSTQGAYLGKNIDSFAKPEALLERFNNKWLTAQEAHNYLTVQEGEQFRYGHIIENLKVVEHPPLYLMLLHTVCSFFPDVFSKWQGLGLNFVFWIFLLYACFKLGMLVLQDKNLSVAAVALFAFSEAGFSMLLFIRMYLLQVLFFVLLLYETLKLLQQNTANRKSLGLIFLYSLLGMLTHYNSVLFSFILAAVSCLILLRRHNWKLLWGYAGVMLFSFGAFLVLFPPAMDVMFHSMRGTQALDKANLGRRVMTEKWLLLDRGISAWNRRIAQIFFGNLWNLPQGGYLHYIIGYATVIGGVIYCRCRKFETVDILFVITVVLFTLLLWLMPEMDFFDARYYFPLLPLMAVLSIYALQRILECFSKKTSTYVTVCGVVSCLVALNSATVVAGFEHEGAYSFHYNEEEQKFVQAMQRGDVFLVSLDVFDLFWLVKDGKKMFMVKDLCSVEGVEQLKWMTGYLLVYNAVIQNVEMKYNTQKINLNCPEAEDYLTYLRTMPMSRRIFDVYRIHKKTP